MAESRERARFALEPREPIRILREQVWQDFDRDIALQLRVACAVDLAHAALTDRLDDFVNAEADAES